MAVEGSGGDCRGSELYRYCNSSLASYVDATVFNPNVNPFHPANQLSGVPGGYKPEVLLPLELHFPAMPNDRPLIIPGPVIDAAELADLILDTFPVILPGLDTLIEIFPAIERDFFQKVVCTESADETIKWNKGSFNSVEESLDYHYNKHGKEVGANSKAQYLRKAKDFSRTAKKGSAKSQVNGKVEGAIRYRKNGKYIDIAPDKSIISFGK